LEREGEPGLEAQVDQAAVRIEEITVANALGALGKGQARSVLAVEQFDGPAGLLATQDTNPSFAQAALPDGLLHEILFALAAG
jgi:hypothetical protein